MDKTTGFEPGISGIEAIALPLSKGEFYAINWISSVL